MRAWQALFGFLLLLSVLHTVQIKGQFNIETGLADVAPELATSEQSKNAIADLQNDIERRIILLVSGQDEDEVFDATDELRTKLESIDGISVLPSNEQLLEQLTDSLTPHRFHLLSETQTKKLLNKSQQELANQAKRDAFSISPARLYSFALDPFGTSSDSVLEVLQSLRTETPEQSDLVYQNVALLLQNQKLGMTEQANLGAELNAVIQDLKTKFEVQIDRSGVFFFANHAAQESKKDVSLISTVSTVGVVILLLWVFRSFTALILPLVSIGVGVAFAFVSTHFVFGQVHVLTIVFGASLIGIVIDYSLHYFYHSAASDIELEQTNDKNSNGERSALHRALLLSLCTSLIGYAALSFSGLDALKKVALFSCCGLLMAWLSVVCAGQRISQGRIRVKSSGLAKLVNAIRGLLRRINPKVIAISASLIFITSVVTWLGVKPVSDDPRVFFNAPAELLASERRVAAVSNDYEPGRYVLLLGESLTQIQTRYLELQSALAQQTQIPTSALSSVLGLVPTEAQQQRAYELQAKLYGQDGALDVLSQTLSITAETISALQTDYLRANQQFLHPQTVQQALGNALPPMWFANDLGYVGFVLVKKGVNADELDAATQTLDGIEYVNTLEKTQDALKKQRISAARLLIVAYGLVALLLILRFRSMNAATMILVPLTASAALITLTTPFTYQLNLFHVMALFLVLGFGMDYTIFVREMRAHQNKTLQAILLSALTSLLSFGLLSFSSIPVVASFGTALLIGNSFNLLGAFAYARVTETSRQNEYG